jgi:hypothetical protein
VLDDDDRVALVDELAQHVQQTLQSSKVQPVVGSSRM